MTVLEEVENVIQDVLTVNGSLVHRGHVVALSLFCAVDMVSSYAYQDTDQDSCETCRRGDPVGPRYRRFIEEHFPTAYREHAAEIYANYRNSAVHSWHLFRVGIMPGREAIEKRNDTIVFGLENFFEALKAGVEDFLTRLGTDAGLQASVLKRYAQLRASARP